MDNKSIVVTANGHNQTIDKISVKLFEVSDANTYCNTINSVELKGDTWIFAKIVNENVHYGLDVFLQINFSNVILKLDNRAIQKVLMEIDSQVLAKALKGQDAPVLERIFSNVSKRAAEFLREDMEYMGRIRLREVNESQDKILTIIRHLDQQGEIVIPNYEGDCVE